MKDTFYEELQRHANQAVDFSTLAPPLSTLYAYAPELSLLSHLKKGLSFEKKHSRSSLVPKEPPENEAYSLKRSPEMDIFHIGGA